MSSIEVDLDDTYELEVTYFDPGSPSKWDDPGSGAEIELGNDVKVWGLDFVPNGPGSGNGRPAVIDRISLDDLIARYAEHHEISKDTARNCLEEECIEAMAQQMEDDYDDSDV